jgi:tetratricopeptide (TPR) repeat protein
MDPQPISDTPAPRRFFRLADWAAFWAAGVVSFLVYFLTLAPSVTLEDSGELAVAGDYLGVPHPPGYPIWTMCVWAFARAFEWVTFRGQPTPAWSIALASAVFGALAAGLTAMLISRTGADLLRETRRESDREPDTAHEGLICFAGGVAGSLLFAFSPVMWSQATIVEVYTLNAFFLMLVLLLSYRWMRRPTDRLLWVTAFVFGLGLTNYQVLLLAAVPLAVVVFLRNVLLFRDFLLLGIPFLATVLVLKLGAEPPVPGFPKHPAMIGTTLSPSPALFLAGLIAAGIALLAALFWHEWSRARAERVDRHGGRALAILAAAFGLAVALLLAAGLCPVEVKLAGKLPGPLVAPRFYCWSALLAVAAVALCVLAPLWRRERGWSDPSAWGPLLAAGVLLLALLGLLARLPAAPPVLTSERPPFEWGLYTAAFAGMMVLVLGLGLSTPRGIYFAAAVVVVETGLFLLVRRGALLGLTHPSTWWFATPVILNFVFLALAWLLLPHGRTAALTLLAAEAGVAFYIYMPIVSDLRNPPMNWGYPRTWEGFKHAITRGQYEKIAPTKVLSLTFIQQLGSYFTDLRLQYTLLVAPLGFLPFALWRVRGGSRQRSAAALVAAAGGLIFAAALWLAAHGLTASAAAPAAAGSLGARLPGLLRGLSVVSGLAGMGTAVWVLGVRPLHLAVGLFGAAGALVLAGEFALLGGFFEAVRLDKLLLGGVLVLLLVGVAAVAITQLDELAEHTLRRRDLSECATVGTVLAGCAAALVAVLARVFQVLLAARFPELARRSPVLAGVAAALLAVLAAGTLIVVLPALRRRLARVRDFRFDADAIVQQWLIATLAAFLMMSVLLIVLANPKGDLQDAFIQKVKFISSHGLFAIWIGYGLVVGLAFFDALLGRLIRRPADGRPSPLVRTGRTAAAVLVLGLPLIPIHQNYFNQQLVFELGGGEQNGHDFGWQFGNYQLRGAEAIAEELAPDEEPLPNPSFPPAMGPRAVFFGGTDPGRFVPTYMIYSARVREDVFLITQNALADNTYMSVMRDLYGDRIWIPTPDDSARAFQIYVDEVNTGKRPKNADLTIENGRVQVSGALGVMEINGILCDMIFQRNKARHNFYVEESYVIPWMFPFLTPHGLIMQIQPEPAAIPAVNVRDDLDFWDWYSRRLALNGRFVRDVVAQKSFSKLRSAIGGCYAARGMLREAEDAFQQARVLYKVSPEANFRLVQEVLLRQRRYDESVDILDQYVRLDPNNDRGHGFRANILNIQRQEKRLMDLLTRLPPSGRPGPALALELAECYRDLGNNAMVARALEPLIADPEATLGQVFKAGLRLNEAGQHEPAARAMDRVMAASGGNTDSDNLLSIARVYADANLPDRMIAPLSRYLQLRPRDWQAWLDLATLYLMQRQAAPAQAALRRAMELGGREARQAIQENPHLRPLVAPGPQSLPGFALPPSAQPPQAQPMAQRP